MRGFTIEVGPLEKMEWHVSAYNKTTTFPLFTTFTFTKEKNLVASHTWEVEDIKVTVITQNWAVPLMGQTSNFFVSLKWALEQGDSSLREDLDEQISCEDGKNGPSAALRKVVGLLYLGLKTLTYGGKLLITRVNPFKPQQSKTHFLMIAKGK